MELLGYTYYRYRTAFASMFVLMCVLMLAALITATGKGTVFDTHNRPAEKPIPTRGYGTPNYVTEASYELISGSKSLTIASGATIFKTSQAITGVGSTVANAGLNTVQAVANGAALAAKTVGSGVLAVVDGAANAPTAITNTEMVSGYIQPAKTTTTQIPVIDAKTSLAFLDKLNAEERAQVAKQIDEQLAQNKRLVGAVVAGDPARGGYPAKWANAPQDSLVDNWGMYSRECVSYAAWKVYQTYGHMPYWGGVGNANQWVRNAKRTGIPTSTVPKVGSVAISMAGYYGHAMWVEAVEGNMIYISQYNYHLNGRYSEMWVDGRNFTYIYFR